MAALSRLTSQRAVLQALAEFDQLGRTAFLTKYQYGRARSYVLIHDGKEYDSKTIVGVAWGKQHGRSLTAQDFSGGEKTAFTLAHQRKNSRIGQNCSVLAFAGDAELRRLGPRNAA